MKQKNRKTPNQTKKERFSNNLRFPKCERKHLNRINHPNQTKQKIESKLEKKREFKNETKSHVSNRNLKRLKKEFQTKTEKLNHCIIKKTFINEFSNEKIFCFLF